MAMIKCAECGHGVSSEAAACPSCGAKPRVRKKRRYVWWLTGTLVLLVVALSSAQRSSEFRAAANAEAARRAGLTPEQRAKEDTQKAESEAAEKREQENRKARQANVSLAEVTCQMAAEASAHDPSSIEWLRSERQFSFTTADMTRAVSVQPMRAKNAMGALTRGAIRCELRKVNGTWTVVKFGEDK